MLTATSRRTQHIAPRHEAITRAPSPVNDGFEPCVRALIRSLSFAAMPPEECREPSAFLAAFVRSYDELRAASVGIERMVEATYLVAADDRTKEKLVDLKCLAAREAAGILRDAPVLAEDCDRHIARIKTASPSDAYRYCATMLGQRAVQVIGRAKYCLDALRDRGMAGSVTWGHRECAFTYPRCVVSDAETARAESSTEAVEHGKGRLFNVTRSTVTSVAERTIETRSMHCTVRHRISRPDIHPVTAHDVPTPVRINPLLDVLPPCLLSSVITGDLLEMSVEEEPLGTRTDKVMETLVRSTIERQVNWNTVAVIAGTAGLAAVAIAALPFAAIGAAVFGATHDPALVVGNGQYVLAGWLPSELPYYQQHSVRLA